MFIPIWDFFTTSNISVELLSHMKAGHIPETGQRTKYDEMSSNHSLREGDFKIFWKSKQDEKQKNKKRTELKFFF